MAEKKINNYFFAPPRRCLPGEDVAQTGEKAFVKRNQ
jgi:hypothetical protein